MRSKITIRDSASLKPLSGYTVRLYRYKDTSPYYDSNKLIGTFTDEGNGTYHIDLEESVKGTVVITTPTSGETIVPQNYIGYYFPGDNVPEVSKKDVSPSTGEETFDVK